MFRALFFTGIIALLSMIPLFIYRSDEWMGLCILGFLLAVCTFFFYRWWRQGWRLKFRRIYIGD